MGRGGAVVVGTPVSSLLSSRKEVAVLSSVLMAGTREGRTAPCNKEVEARNQPLVV
jgi:hypothetical protein